MDVSRWFVENALLNPTKTEAVSWHKSVAVRSTDHKVSMSQELNAVY